MTQPERGEFLTTQGVAEELGVSRGRIQQMITEGKLPPPTNLGARLHLWHRSDIEFVRAQLAGDAPTFASGVLRAPLRGLARTVEEILEIALPWATMTLEVHVRVWHGPAPEGLRTVVVLGQPPNTIGLNPHLDAVMSAVAPLLAVPVREAVWFHYHPSASRGGQEVDNLVLTFPAEADDEPSDSANGLSRVRHFFRRVPLVLSPEVRGRWRPVSISEVERVIGAPLEAYPAAAYHRRTIEQWTTSKRQVEVEHDVINYRELAAAARALHSAVELAPQADRRQCLIDAVHLLADEIRKRDAHAGSRRWHDGTIPTWDVSEENWPTTWAARLVRPRISDADQALIDAYPEPFTIPPDPMEHTALQEMLVVLREEMRATDDHSDNPEPILHEALRTATGILAFYLGVYDPTFRERDHPDRRPRPLAIAGRHDRAYLAGLTPIDIQEQTHPDREQARSYRILRSTLGGLVTHPDRLRQGLDPDGRLVLYYDTAAGNATTSTSTGWFAVEWPQVPPTSPIASGTRIVSDPAPGDRPAYLVDPAGTMSLLPGDPTDNFRCDHWNFGADGEGVGPLTRAITSTFAHADGIDRARMPTAWITDHLTYLGEDELNLSTEEFRRRYR